MNKTHILVININNLRYTQDCISDLLKQDASFDLTIIDQNSNEPGTFEWYDSLENGGWTRKDCSLQIIRNKTHLWLNHVWNSFHEQTQNPYLCYLNNDVRLTRNFISDGEKIFEKEPKVGCVCHPSNHPKYTKRTALNYALIDGGVKQGWDYTLRREAYNPIPEVLHIWCGDDYLFEMLFRQGWKLAMACSSPIIHYQGKSGVSAPDKMGRDIPRYKKLGFEHNLKRVREYSNQRPTIDFQIYDTDD